LTRASSLTLTGEEHKRLGGKLTTSPRDLTTREHSLPWALSSFPRFLGQVKNALSADTVPTVAGGACSRTVNAGSGLRVRRVAIAVRGVSKRPAAGGVGGPANAIAPAGTARNVAGSKASGTACVSANDS